MKNDRQRRTTTLILIAIAVAVFILHCLTNHQYGFHRDELQTLDDCRYMDWGFVAYPPLTPFFARLSLILFGNSVAGARVFPALAQAVVIVLAGLITRELAGRRLAQIIAALATAAAPVALAAGALLQYVAFDFLWWVLLAYFMLRLINSNDPRWWIAVGAAIGLGMMTKYTMLFLVVGVAVGVLTSDLRKHLRSRWLWIGVGVSLLIFLPNAIWQIRHDFISLDFLKYIHARDIRWGRTKDFLPEQLYVAANPLTIPLWLGGLVYLFFHREGRRFRLLGWMAVVPFVLFVIAKGRSYYMAPAYPMLLAAGSVWWERWLKSATDDVGPGAPAQSTAAQQRLLPKFAIAATFVILTFAFLLAAYYVLPIPVINSDWFRKADNGDFREEIGWTDLVAEVARIRDTLPAEQRASVAIFAANYGEAGAIGMYRDKYGLPKAISWTNTYWLRGYPDPPPETLIVLGFSREAADHFFESCTLAGHNGNSYGVKNEESSDHPDIFLCHHLKTPWPEFWKTHRRFG
jgi:4-amino-4-deoxy-L-arabinose transferase-like glycosyltransferase